MTFSVTRAKRSRLALVDFVAGSWCLSPSVWSVAGVQ